MLLKFNRGGFNPPLKVRNSPALAKTYIINHISGSQRSNKKTSSTTEGFKFFN